MTYAERSDAQLLELSRQGLASAFCVLVHRHGPTVLHHARTDDDPIGATSATFIRAMRTLPDADRDDVAGWLLDLTADELGVDRGSLSDDATVPMQPTSPHGPASPTATIAIDPRLDEVWADLAPRWPSGTKRRHLPSWAIWIGTILVLMGLAILVPWAVLGSHGNGDPVIPEVRASPVLEDRQVEEEPDDEEDEEEPEPLPTFEFPEPPDEDGSVPEPDPEPTPTPDPTDDAPSEAPAAPDPGDDAPLDTDPGDDTTTEDGTTGEDGTTTGQDPDPSGAEPDDDVPDDDPAEDASAGDAPADDPPPDRDDDTTGGDAAQPVVTEGETP